MQISLSLMSGRKEGKERRQGGEGRGTLEGNKEKFCGEREGETPPRAHQGLPLKESNRGPRRVEVGHHAAEVVPHTDSHFVEIA